MARDLNRWKSPESRGGGLLRSCSSFLFSRLPVRDSLLVLTYHRIGNPEDHLFDPGVFSATAEQLDDQISHLKRYASLLTVQEALAFIDGKLTKKAHRFCALITFDDGYLDNYTTAFPILHSHGVQAVFFLVTSMVGSCQVPWWDHIAYVVKTSRRRKFTLRYPTNLVVDLDLNGLTQTLRDILKLYKQPQNSDHRRFLQELSQEAEGEELPGTARRFLNLGRSTRNDWKWDGDRIPHAFAFCA